MSTTHQFDVAIIGAGPAGAIAAGILRQKGHQVCIIEREHFPRFSIGESLLPHCMEFIDQAGMLEALQQQADALGFQFKDGAAFHRAGEDCIYYFTEKFSPGPGTTYQVKRAQFDQLLAEQAVKQGAEIRFGHQVEAVEFNEQCAQLTVKDLATEQTYQLQSEFILDASGFGRVLPRLLDLEVASQLANRTALFGHVKDGADAEFFDRNKILITVHPEHNDVWFWLIPFSDGTASLGVVGETDFFDNNKSKQQQLWDCVQADPNLAKILAKAEFITEVRSLGGYSASVKALYGERFALLGNAGEFLDPVFSSGVTIAIRSAAMAAKVLDKQLSGQAVDWQSEYSEPLAKGVATFKEFVMSWYDISLQDVIFFNKRNDEVKQKITSILAGYAWDLENPFVKDSKRGIRALSNFCQMQAE